jgi:hypothetical protein
VTNNEANAASRILHQYGIDHKLQNHRLPLTSNDFAIGIGIFWFADFEDICRYVQHVASRYRDASVDLTSRMVTEDLAKIAKRNTNADKP